MFMVVTGGSGSGKSAYAEQQVLALGEKKRYYIATMRCGDEESRRRIERHRSMRRDRQFETLECPVDIHRLRLQPGSVALLECMSNLAANEFFDGAPHTPQETADKIMAGVERIAAQCEHLIVVTNEIFSDGVRFDAMTEQYLECLGRINCAMAAAAQSLVEVVYGIPILQKPAGEET